MVSAFSKQVRILTLDIIFNNRRGLDVSLCALKHDVFQSKWDVLTAGRVYSRIQILVGSLHETNKGFPRLGCRSLLKEKVHGAEAPQSTGLICFIPRDWGHLYSWRNPEGLSEYWEWDFWGFFSRLEKEKKNQTLWLSGQVKHIDGAKNLRFVSEGFVCRGGLTLISPLLMHF